jgi:protocatechuate 3,4-dioxygenase beta subunit
VEWRRHDRTGKPVAGAQVEIWQCDEGATTTTRVTAAGPNRVQGFGRITVGSDGRYRFRTIRPVAYGGRTPHIHFKVKLQRRELLTTQMYVEERAAQLSATSSGEQGRGRALLTVPSSRETTAAGKLSHRRRRLGRRMPA